MLDGLAATAMLVIVAAGAVMVIGVDPVTFV
jgi:hypothetical protein